MEERQNLYIEDENTKWFGVARDSNGQLVFQDYGRYANIMADNAVGVHKHRYPQLVSFIGQTGAGKSTLVKMLIDQQGEIAPIDAPPFCHLLWGRCVTKMYKLLGMFIFMWIPISF